MLEKPDAGALVDQQPVPIGENDTALEVSQRVAEAAQTVLRRSLPKLIAGSAAARPLDLAQGSYFGRRRAEDGRIDWRAGSRAVHDLVRAVAPPFPGRLHRGERATARGVGDAHRRRSAAPPRTGAVPVRGGGALVCRLHGRQASGDRQTGNRREHSHAGRGAGSALRRAVGIELI